MGKIIIAKVAVSNTNYIFDKEYTYAIDESLVDKIKLGCRVLIPFGRSNKKRIGIVLSLEEKENINKNVKFVYDLLDQKPILTKEFIELTFFIKKRYYCTFYEAIKIMLPSGAQLNPCTFYKINSKRCNENFNKLTQEEKSILNFVKKSATGILESKLLSKLNIESNDKSLINLVNNGILIKNNTAKRKIGDFSLKLVRLNKNITNFEAKYKKLTKKQLAVYNMILKMGSASVKELCYFLGITTSVVNSLVKKGIAVCFEEKIYRNPFKENLLEERKEIKLTKQQQNICDDLVKQYYDDKANVALLYGITGSGKTSVFIKLIDKVYNENKGIIVMVPEISLTPQMISIFRKRYGNDVALFHSGLSMGERLDEWERVKQGKAKIAIGTRSAVFAPFNNLGLVIIDEEQEYTYKSDAKPRFHARDIAKFRCAYNNALLVLSSATPSVESYYWAKNGKYSLNCLETRYGTANLPEVCVVDMNKEILNGNSSMFSKKLLNDLKTTISNGNQAILLLNRRGHSTFAVCRNCKEVLTCPNCSISLSYHSDNNRLMCHYCGLSIPFTYKCPGCNKNEVRYMGLGTQKAESDLKSILPDARILRMDTDATMSKFSYQNKLYDFAHGKYDIMIGTQMVAKGLDFENVTLVGVLSADQSLYNDDFRSYERTFSLLTQVVGRAGRGQKKGKAIIQTFTPENNIIKLAANQDYKKFYTSEIALRKALVYPPYVDICVVVFTGNNNEKTQKASQLFFDILKKDVTQKYNDLPLKVLKPSLAKVAKVNNKYRYRLLIKCKNNKAFQKMMAELLKEFLNNKICKNVTAFVDINPDVII